MQARFLHDGKSIDYIPESDIAAGTVVVEGDLVGITKLDIPAGGLGALHVVGVYAVAKGVNAITLGAKVYWDNTAKQATTTSTGNKPLGLVVAEATADDSIVLVRLG